MNPLAPLEGHGLDVVAALLAGEVVRVGGLGKTKHALLDRRLVVEREDGTLALGGPGYDAARAAAICLEQHCEEGGCLTGHHRDVARRMGVIPTAARIALYRARDLGWVKLTSRRIGGPRYGGTWSRVPGTTVPRG